ncbi:MAG: putative maltokinase [Chloroherpetonaceae bacterium]|nr:putative maltokinase [Chloroherpetonaceae bacterium]MDW8438493.1 putative maltokinase [Chloroherpetonaceae bacterium]
MSNAVSRLSLDALAELFEEPNIVHLERHLLPNYLKQRRWFASKASGIKRLRIAERLIPRDSLFALLLLDVELVGKSAERYFVPISLAPSKKRDKIFRRFPQSLIGDVSFRGEPASLIDAIYDDDFRAFFFSALAHNLSLKGARGRFKFAHRDGAFFESIPASKVLAVEQSNSSIRYGDGLFMKVYRKLETGLNPDAEILSFLTKESAFEQAPKYVGDVRFCEGSSQTALALLQTFTKNKSSAWNLALAQVKSFYDKVSRKPEETIRVSSSFFARLDAPVLPLVKKNAGKFLDHASLLGKRTAELHLALASSNRAAFKPEPFTEENQNRLRAELRAEAKATLKLLQEKLSELPSDAKPYAEAILSNRQSIFARLDALTRSPIVARKIRVHGDYHLGQVLFTGNDFVIIDFEGEPMRPIEERRAKRPAFQDLAGMIRSFHYAVYAALLQDPTRPREALNRLTTFGELWFYETSRAFLKAYLRAAGDASFIPKSLDERERLLESFLLSKAMYELLYELNNRPDWVMIPLRGVTQILSEP